MSVTSIQRLTVPVSDQEAAKAFYTDVLGLRVVREAPVPMGNNARWIEVAAGGGTSMVLANWFPTAPGSLRGLMLESSDLDGDCDRLKAAGRPVQGPTATPWGRQAVCSDPDGNEFVLVEGGAA